MSESLDDIFSRRAEAEPAPAEQREPEPQPEPEAKEAPSPEPEAAEPKPEGEEEPQQPAPNDKRTVPLAALESERKARQDYKERAARLEGEAAELRKQLDELKRQPPQQQPQQQLTDEERFFAQVQERAQRAAVEASISRELNRSERAARARYGDEAVDAAFAEYQRVYQMAPQIQQVVLEQPDPYDFIVQQSQHVREVGEFSRDGAAYRARLEAEIRAQMAGQATQPQQTPQAPPRATAPSLARAPNAGSRTGPAFTGPPPLEDIFRR